MKYHDKRAKSLLIFHKYCTHRIKEWKGLEHTVGADVIISSCMTSSCFTSNCSPCLFW